MEIEEGENKRPPEGDKSTKRKMKTAYQLELLEKTYAVATYPSESMRAELSEKLGLTDRQLQMWFCHRRLKDRKDPRKRSRNEMAAGSGDEVLVGTAEEPVNELALGPVLGSGHFSQGETRRARPRAAVAVARIGGKLPVMKRYCEPPGSILELRAIAFVESQLGEPLREDGPVLGVEFDPLPPDAFGAPMAAMEGQQNQVMRPYDTKMFERQEMKLIKASSFIPSMEQSFVPSFSGGRRKPPVGSVHAIHPETGARALHEYQVLPKQPSVRSDVYERVGPSHLYDTPLDASSGRATSLASGGSFLHETDQVGAGYNFQGEVSNVTMSQRGRQSHVFSSSSTDYDSVLHISTLANIPADAQFGAHPVIRLENSFVSPNRQASLNEDALRMERKRKSEEARIGKEVEAHEKQIRKELEKQDIMRRKREEQMRREMEKHDRERRKEEERLMREKQREEERLQREQRREIERQERFLQKETLRAEKMRQKEDLRREKKAARIKAANERATARRIARESMELIEDERLELMELAASSKGLPSIISLDCDTLQNLESFRDTLSMFPPKSVPLKRPFTVQPWILSEEIIGNLLMVWKFLITFADALELWPFTLDEFVQAFHDYDPRLLGEIHVSLLKSIIKDIEDATRTPSIELGANQNAAANPGGGHPQIVEGAHAWGFDISSWQRHLNPLTWPEILRQFALSAGFGPQLKKRSVPQACFYDENEGNDDEYVISTLRNGVAAESAVARMKEKGFSYWRRSRRRLTPGTVKFAAFHVLSLEGSEGLTILEVADKIQKSGLRDLTTSKTPEASIAAALSRDTTLFERTAPSTYCVQPAFRKDPANADAILLAAREKLRIFQSRFSDPEEAEKDTEDTDDVERDDDSESEGAEDPEVDDLGNPPTLDKVVFHPNVMKDAQESGCVQNGKGEAACSDINETSPGFSSEGKGLSPFPLDGTKSISSNSQLLDVAAKCHEVSNADQEDTEIDESNSGEPWVQGLMEGEYSDLSIEERLNALVALIGVAIEGNSIRVILEERLEAANALKKQMWAEAQLDKRRIKEEYVTKLQYPSFAGTKAEVNLAGSAIYGNHSPLCNLDNKSNETSLNPAAKEELQYGHAAEKPRSQLKSYIGHRAEQMYVYRSLPLGQDRRRNRYWQFSTSSRNDPGSGRIFFESHDGCWRLIDSEEGFDALLDSLDRRGIRESHLYSMLQKIEMSFKETVRKNLDLTNSVDISRVSVKEESVPSSSDGSMGTDSLSTVCGPNSDTLELSLSFRIELGRNEIEKNNALKRYQDSQKWLWRECFNMPILCAMKDGKKRCPELLTACDVCHDLFLSEDEHCAFCHKTFQSVHNLDIEYSEHVNCGKQKVNSSWNFHFSNCPLPTRIQVLKAQLALIEASIPPEVFQPFWTEVNRKSWGAKLHSTSSSEDILQLLTLLECAIKRGGLSSNFETTKELLGSCTIIAFPVDEGATLPATVPILPWIPQTTASVALRLMELDASISYLLQKTVESRKDKESGNFIKLPSRHAVIKNAQDLEPAGTPERAEYELEEIWADSRRGCKVQPNMNPVRVRGSRGRGLGRSHGGRSQRGSGSSRTKSTRQNPWNSDKSVRRQGGRPRTRGQGQRRGRRTMKRKKKPENKVVAKETALGGFGDMRRVEQISSGGSPRISEREWDGEETGRIYAEERNDNSAGISESDDNGLALEDESGDQVDADYADVYDGKSEVLMDDSEEEDDEDEEGDRDGEEEGDRDGIEDEDGDAGMDGYEDSHGEGNGDEDDGNGEGNGDEDEGTSSTSSDCSD